MSLEYGIKYVSIKDEVIFSLNNALDHNNEYLR